MPCHYEISEINSVAIFLALETLVDKVESDSGSKIGRPAVLVGRKRQPIDDITVKAEHGCDLAQTEIHAGAKIEARSKNWADLPLHANDDQFRIERNSATNTDLISSCFSFYIPFQAANTFGYSRCIIGIGLRIPSLN